MANKTTPEPEMLTIQIPAPPPPRVVVKPPTEDADGYPLPLAIPGDAANVDECLAALSRLTDVASVTTILRAAVSRARAVRVRPDVIAGVLAPPPVPVVAKK